MASSQPFQTDSIRPTSLPSANLGHRVLGASSAEPSANDHDHDQAAEEWNGRIDRELKSLVGGLKELVRVADLTPTPQALSGPLLPLHLSLQTSSLIRSAQNLRDMAHELKLLLLLGDEASTARNRDNEMTRLGIEVDQRRREVVREAVEVFGGGSKLIQSETEGVNDQEAVEGVNDDELLEGVNNGGNVEGDNNGENVEGVNDQEAIEGENVEAEEERRREEENERDGEDKEMSRRDDDGAIGSEDAEEQVSMDIDDDFEEIA
ncbi:hypothetical protein BCR39DRAFT_601404 [Naematelia encephala]|uniref:Uncharacterized protein n=1 Tax=Naematelia encephala TaxID=71784 RepID=A0A1Y2AEH2_9TREE|nr:hypothetical protein BCR39DRAFT_601404 [Naematelia encephala]